MTSDIAQDIAQTARLYCIDTETNEILSECSYTLKKKWWMGNKDYAEMLNNRRYYLLAVMFGLNIEKKYMSNL